MQAIYTAFGQGDVPTILGHLADDVVWDHSDVASSECPWNGNFSGKANVPGVFETVAENVDFESGVFAPRTFNDQGLVKRYQHFNDTAAELAAWKS